MTAPIVTKTDRNGKCSGCGDPFGEGERIRADGTGHGYLHERCEA